MTMGNFFNSAGTILVVFPNLSSHVDGTFRSNPPPPPQMPFFPIEKAETSTFSTSRVSRGVDPAPHRHLQGVLHCAGGHRLLAREAELSDNQVQAPRPTGGTDEPLVGASRWDGRAVGVGPVVEQMLGGGGVETMKFGKEQTRWVWMSRLKRSQLGLDLVDRQLWMSTCFWAGYGPKACAFQFL